MVRSALSSDSCACILVTAFVSCRQCGKAFFLSDVGYFLRFLLMKLVVPVSHAAQMQNTLSRMDDQSL